MSRLGPLGWQWPRNEGNTLLGWSPSGRELRNYPLSDIADLASFLQAGTGAVSRTVQSKLRDIVSVRDFGAAGDGVTNDTAAIQAAIDSLTQGGEVVFPRGIYIHTGLRIDGSAGSRSNISLRGVGPSSKLYLQTGVTANSVSAATGGGFVISDLAIEGNRSRGGTGVPGPTRGFWTASTAYVLNDTVEVTVADLTATSVFSTNRVYRCTSSHTSSGTFLADKATRWTLVSDANFFTSDVSYGTRNGVYLDGVAGALVTRCWIFDHIYAGLNIGSGPVQAVNAGPGADFVSVQANNIYGNGNGIAGGKMRYVNIDGNTVRDNITYQIVSDTGSAQVSVTGNNVKGGASHGIFFYNVNYGTISGNTVAGAGGVGILLDNSSAITAVQGNSVNACLQGIRVYNTPVGTIAGNAVNGNTQHGIAVELASQTALQGNVSQGNGFDGIRITSCSAFSITGNVCSLNVGQAGIYLDGCSLGTVTGNVTFDNNNTGSPPTDGAGIRLHNSASTTVVANQSYDSRASGLKTQRYGVRSTGTSDANTLGANRLSGNAVADYLLTGTANRVTVDTANVTSATTPGNFTASNVLSFVQPDGTIAYVPCRLSAW